MTQDSTPVQAVETHGLDDIHKPEEACNATISISMLSRRTFLFGAGAALTWLNMPAWMHSGEVRGREMPSRVQAQVAQFDPQRIASFSDLVVGEPVMFMYPWDHPNSTNYLLKLGQPAGSGIGPNEDVVAFNSFCTHMGGPLAGTFKADQGVAGPCPLHWTLFDLTRHGMVVAGHATMGLPQITLELDGDDILATGVMGLIFGYHDNNVDPNTI